jgi:hypothetical protein
VRDLNRLSLTRVYPNLNSLQGYLFWGNITDGTQGNDDMNKRYLVTVRATVRQTVEVGALDADTAMIEATDPRWLDFGDWEAMTVEAIDIEEEQVDLP